jgi:hypothetical protein
LSKSSKAGFSSAAIASNVAVEKPDVDPVLVNFTVYGQVHTVKV